MFRALVVSMVCVMLASVTAKAGEPKEKEITPVQFVETMNRAYAAKDLAAILSNLDDEVVFVVPEDPAPWRGKQTISERLKTFFSEYTITGLKATDYRVRTAGDVAIVTYVYETRLQHGGKELVLPGKETYVLRKAGASWRVLHDQLTPTQ